MCVSIGSSQPLLLAISGTQARDPLAMCVVAGFLFFFHVRVVHGVGVARRCRWLSHVAHNVNVISSRKKIQFLLKMDIFIKR